MVTYAGFLRRAAAAFIDGFILMSMNKAFEFLIFYDQPVIWNDLLKNMTIHRKPNGVVVAIFFGSYLVSWLYYALMESSERQATVGKMALGLQVTDNELHPLTFARASGRFFSKLVSYATFCIGFLMAGWTERKQALHDKIAGTLVIRKPSVREEEISPINAE